jgi:hypothetical protein
MKVIWRQKDRDWEIAFGKSYKDETQLQAFLAEYPTMIPFEDVSEGILHPRVMLREVGLPGSGSTDIVGIDEAGGITILECKLATNPEVKRKVIGQVLEYAAYLWRKPYGFLDEVSQARLGKPLAEAMKGSLDDEALQDWEETGFVRAVSDRLLSGDFRIVVAVDAINDELRQTIEYLTEGPSRLQIYALELTYFASGDQEILVPHLYGSIVAAAVPSRATSMWDAERFFADARQRDLPDDVVTRMESLLEFAGETASTVYWGRGKETGSFTYYVLRDDRVFSLFSVFSDGRLVVNFGFLKEKLPTSLLATYRESLRRIPSMKDLPMREDFNYWPTVRLVKALREPSDMAAFQQAVVALRDGVLEQT